MDPKMDPNIARLIERTKARRNELREVNTDGSPLPSEKQRSPLKERNTQSPTRVHTPVKGSTEIPITRSPSKVQFDENPSDTIRKLLSRESLENDVQELIHRQSPGQGLVTRTVSTKRTVSPGKGSTTITKTVVTEKEERFEKTETISYSGNKEFLKSLDLDSVTSDGEKSVESNQSEERSVRMTKSQSPHKIQSPHTFSDTENRAPDLDLNDLQAGRKARLANLANKLKHIDNDDEMVIKDEVRLPKPVCKPIPRAPSPTKHAPVKMDHLRHRSPSPVKGHHMQFVSPTKSPTKSSSIPPSTSPPTSVGFRSILTTKASMAPPSLPTSALSTQFRSVSPTKSMNTATPSYRSVSPSKSTDSSFITSLKAQGFQETDSKSKLVYDFENRSSQSPERTNYADNVFLRNDSAAKDEARSRPRDQLSPMREETERSNNKDRSPSPVRNNVFIQRDQERGRTQVRKSQQKSDTEERSHSPVKNNVFFQRDQEREQERERSRSPNRKYQHERDISTTKSAVRAPSPTKPNVRAPSPTKSYQPQPVVSQPVQPSVQGPPKPTRTYQTLAVQETREDKSTTHQFMDTLQTKTVDQKRSMFESKLPPMEESPDPSSIPLSQRKALFEKIKSVPTPIARFGESVTPAMLAKNKVQAAEEKPSEAWKRKRVASPGRALSPKKETGSNPPWVKETQVATPKQPMMGMEDRQRRLFAASAPDWRENEIAKKAAMEKQAEMDLLMNRYKHMKKDSPPIPTVTPTVHRSEPSSSPSEPISELAPPPPVQKTEAAPTTGHISQPVPPPIGQMCEPGSPPCPSFTPTTDKYYPGVSSMKRVKMSPPKEGNLYPTIDFDSDRCESVLSTDTLDTLNDSYESTATTTVSEVPSLGKEIVMVARHDRQESELTPIPEDNNDSMETDDGERLTDSVLEDALGLDDVDEYDDRPTPPKVVKTSSSSSGSDRVGRSESTTSWEFHTPDVSSYANKKQEKFKTPMIMPSSPGLLSPKVEVEGEESLMHTVSFYRAQKTNTPVQRIVLESKMEENSLPAVLESPRATISQRIHRLQEEAASQMPVIQQASSALNLCRSTKEFFGSSEQVEGERLLLVASHKRAAALTEIQALKTEGGLGVDPRVEGRDSSVRGTVSLCGIKLGLKKDFVEQLRSGEAGMFVHFFLCLVKCAGQVIPTTMVSTAEGLEGDSLHFPNLINFRDLTKDFTIHLEVYGLQTKKEVLAHDVKYHIAGTPKTGGFLSQLTPKMKFSRTETKLSRPAVSSPGGPNTVRTSSFAMVGQSVITISSLCETSRRLSSVPPISPLDGVVNFTLNCHSESQITNRGFLTMFDDVSGFGAWHRRWVVLEGNYLSFWKYPENETKQDPIGRIDLAQCVTEVVSIAPREVCSRMHTFMLETERAASREDRESLVVVRSSRDRTILRHLLSADSRPERMAWCDLLNQALDNIRAWDTARPRSGSISSQDSASSQSTEIW